MNIDNLEGEIFNELKLLGLIGKGSFGVVYKAQSVRTNLKYAIKVQNNKTLSPQLHFQFQVYSYLMRSMRVKKINNEYIPKIYGFFSNKYFTFLVMELFGKNLEKYFKQNKKQLRKQTTLSYAKQILKLIKFLHENDLVYRDLKPQNFVFQLQTNQQQKYEKIFLVDLGLCKKISIAMSDSTKNRHAHSLIGTARYASISSHQGKIITKKDDFQSFLYLIVYLLKGNLPWQGLKIKNAKQKIQPILKMKKKTKIQQLCQGLPFGILQFAEYIKKNEQIQQLDYEYLSKCLEKSFQELNTQNQEIFSIKQFKQQLQKKVKFSQPQIKHQNQKDQNKNKKQQNKRQKEGQNKHQQDLFHYLQVNKSKSNSWIKHGTEQDSQSEQLNKKSQLKRKKKPLLKRQFIIRQDYDQDEINYSSQSSNQHEQPIQKFIIP